MTGTTTGTGPLVCGMSQAVNDWNDRDADAINEPDRPIPSGRVTGRWALSLVVAAVLGPWVFGAAVVAVVLAWAYSAPPLRLKRNGWWETPRSGPATRGCRGSPAPP